MDPSSWGDGIPRFSVAPRVVVMAAYTWERHFDLEGMDSPSSIWPLESGSWTPTIRCGTLSSDYCLRCGPSSWGDWSDGMPRFGVPPPSHGVCLPCFNLAPPVGVMEFHSLVYLLELW